MSDHGQSLPEAPAFGRRRSGSQKRRKSDAVRVACLPDQKARLRELAARSGQSLGAICLHALLAEPLPPARRAANGGDRQAIGQLLAELGRVRGELGKSGSNLNQIAHHLNAGRESDTERAVLSVSAAIEENRRAVGMIEDLWTAFMAAAGHRPEE